MKYSLLLFIFLLNVTGIFAQQDLTAKQLIRNADSLYQAKDYKTAADIYGQAAEAADFKSQKSSAMYNMACCFALAGDTANAFRVLQIAIMEGYDNKSHILQDDDLKSLRGLPLWDFTMAFLKDKPAPNSDPGKAKFVTEDIHRFWNAYDQALKYPAGDVKGVFRSYYFTPASVGMDDYMSLKVNSIDAFVAHILSKPRFYAAIRANTYKVDGFKKDFKKSFQAFKKIYPAAVFPDVYFVIGALTSAGTVSDAGLLIGVNQIALSDDTPLEELSFSQRTRMNKISYMPAIIAHELIHFQQNGMKSDTTTLSYCIKEGMADFIGELISGSNANPNLYAWAKGKEKLIWQRFQADMFENRYANWIANGNQATADNLPDQGYWIGYQICKAYYDRAANKKNAINDMLHIKDYKQFLEQSGWEKKLQDF